MSSKQKNKSKAPEFLSKFLHAKEISIFIPFLMLCLITAIANPVFVRWINVLDNLRSISFYAIVGVGMTFIIIGAGIDLSVGSTIALTGVITGGAMVIGIPVFPAILLGLLTGIIVGLINSSIIIFLKLPPFIATLGTMYIAKGIVYILTKGKPFYPFPDEFLYLAQGKLLGIPYTIFVAAIVVAIGIYLLKNSVFGRSILAIGGNELTARTSGINVNKMKMLSYVMTSFLCAITGILLASRLSSATANAGDGWEMTIIASVIIGGTSMAGGSGSIVGTLIGCGIMTVLSNAMVLLSISAYWQNVVVGVIIIIAVSIDTFRRRKLTGERN